MGEIGATKIAGGALAPIKSNYDGTEPESSNKVRLKNEQDSYEDFFRIRGRTGQGVVGTWQQNNRV